MKKPKKSPKQNQQIYIREIYVESEDLQKTVEWFMETTKNIPTVYFCRYESPKKTFLRTGMFNPTKEQVEMFDKAIEENETILYVKEWLEHPDTKEWDMEMMKFLAFKTFKSIQEHFVTHKEYYLKSPQRERDLYGRHMKPENKTKMSPMDWAHYIHHVFNMMDYSYQYEVYLYNFLEAGIHYNAHVSQLKS